MKLYFAVIPFAALIGFAGVSAVLAPPPGLPGSGLNGALPFVSRAQREVAEAKAATGANDAFVSVPPAAAPGEPPLLTASALGDRVELLVIDRGPGHLSLAPSFVVDATGRATKVTEPNGNGTYTGVTVYNGGVMAHGKALAIQDLILQNHNFDKGTVWITKNGQTLFVLRLDLNINWDQHFVSPILISDKDQLGLKIHCDHPGSGAATCTPGLYFGGKLVDSKG